MSGPVPPLPLLANRKRTGDGGEQDTSYMADTKRSKEIMCDHTTSDMYMDPLSLSCKENVPPPIGLSLREGGVGDSQGFSASLTHTPPPPSGGHEALKGEKKKSNTDSLSSSPPPALPPLLSRGVAPMLARVAPSPHTFLPSPLPPLSWTDSSNLFREMRLKDKSQAAPETELRLRHPSIMPTMRTILLDWMLEVCEEYRIHRETYYLSLELFDRFMDTQTNIRKEQLQLIGVTCLFISSKIEEIYPPKLADFAYVTDGACNSEEIVFMELLICKALNWRLHHCSVSVNTWANLYMQLVSSYFRPHALKAREFEYPAFSPYEFIRVMQVLDLCTLDITSRQFCNSILAASALYLVSEKCQLHLNLVTGFQLTDIHICVQWLTPFVSVINRTSQPVQKAFRGVILQDAHNIQTHEVSINMLEEAQDIIKYQEMMADAGGRGIKGSSQVVPMDCSALMTPPRQERRCLAPINSTTTMV